MGSIDFSCALFWVIFVLYYFLERNEIMHNVEQDTWSVMIGIFNLIMSYHHYSEVH
jgi:hypothetical protein